MPTPTESIRTPLTQLLRIQHPIILAGMNQAAGPKLAAAVSNAGGLGVMGGVAYLPDDLRKHIRELKSLLVDKTNFGVDLILPQVGGSARKTNKAGGRGHLPELVQIIIEEGAKLFVCAAGVAPKWVVDTFHEAGVLCANMVGTADHVDKGVMAGCDIYIATGYEAGGHVGEVGVSSLVPQVVDRCKGKTSPLTGGPVHVVAAGGIVDGRTLASAITLGAEAAWIGTRFVASHETGAVKKAEHQRQILNAKSTDTVRTLIYSGRPLRVYKTPFVMSWEGSTEGRSQIDKLTSQGTLPFQHQRTEAYKNGKLGGQQGWDKPDTFSTAKNHRFNMGQGSALITSILPAREIIETMVTEAVAVLKAKQVQLYTLTPEDAKACSQDIEEPAVPIAPVPDKEFTMEEIAKHTKRDDLWIVVNGKVLDLSISGKNKFDHPGGPQVLTEYAGKDGSDEFNMMHNEMMIHKYRPEALLGRVKSKL